MASWAALRAFAAHQDPERGPWGSAAHQAPLRTLETTAALAAFSGWLSSRAPPLTAEQSVLRYTPWRCADGLALEPNAAPYALQPGIEHFLLWYHPDASGIDGEAELDVARALTDAQRVLREQGAELRSGEAIVFQNVRALRSVLGIAHCPGLGRQGGQGCF